MKIYIVGAGVIGQATGIGLGIRGHEVIFYDVDKEKLKALAEKGYIVCDEISLGIDDVDVIFVCVPTPTINGEMDLSFLQDAVTNIGKALSDAKGYKVVAVRSTVLPSTTRCKVMPLLEKYSGLKAGKDFGVCMNPEFLRERYALEDFLNPSRIIIGELDKRSGDLLEKVYSIFDVPLIRTDLDTAEMIKYVSNLFLATKISFFNEMFLVCQKLGIDANIVGKAVSLDPRIGEYGVYGGSPFDGKCLPKDLEAFLSFVKSLGLNPDLLDAVRSINEKMRLLSSDKKNKKE
ncbi:MAG: nucleotide sugar dehydrogenase [Nitrososphaeria archaeon]